MCYRLIAFNCNRMNKQRCIHISLLLKCRFLFNFLCQTFESVSPIRSKSEFVHWNGGVGSWCRCNCCYCCCCYWIQKPFHLDWPNIAKHCISFRQSECTYSTFERLQHNDKYKHAWSDSYKAYPFHVNRLNMLKILVFAIRFVAMVKYLRTLTDFNGGRFNWNIGFVLFNTTILGWEREI